MITRREIVTGAVMSGAVGDAPGEAAAVPQREADERMVSLLTEIRDELRRGRVDCNANNCPEVERVRNEQRTFLKSRSKFPDYVEVGADIWDRLCDWHVENQLPLQVSRTGEGRYVMPFYQTFVVLRPDVANTYVGQGYDK